MKRLLLSILAAASALQIPVHKRHTNVSLGNLRDLKSRPEYSFTRKEPDGVFFCEIQIGTPPQKFSAIVDTGSSTIAIPCKGCDCGNHNHFDKSKSSTAKETGHTYTQCYSEGSCNHGNILSDVMSLTATADTDSSEQTTSIRHDFGCSDTFAAAFKAQKADGIIGLSGSQNTFLGGLREAHELEEDVFSLCLGMQAGAIQLGEILTDKHMEPIQYFSSSDASFYSFKFSAAYVGDTALSFPSTLSKVDPIVDSGTTFTYVPQFVHDAFRSHFDSFCSSAGKCQGEQNSNKAPSTDVSDAVRCYDKPASMTYSAFMDTFPSIELSFSGQDERICVPPLSYFYLAAKSSEDVETYCVGMLRNSYKSSNKMVIGANFMTGFDVVFDHVKERIGFARSWCDNPDVLEIDASDPEQMQYYTDYFLNYSCCGSCATAQAQLTNPPIRVQTDKPTASPTLSQGVTYPTGYPTKEHNTYSPTHGYIDSDTLEPVSAETEAQKWRNAHGFKSVSVSVAGTVLGLLLLLCAVCAQNIATLCGRIRALCWFADRSRVDYDTVQEQIPLR